jgi:hypothetical protein
MLLESGWTGVPIWRMPVRISAVYVRATNKSVFIGFGQRMSEFFKWVSANPAAGQIVLFALVLIVVLIALAFCAAVILFIWAFFTRRAITIFGFKLSEPTLLYETGRIDLPANKKRELYERNYKGEVSEVVPYRFTKKFEHTPELVIGLVKLDGGIGIVRVEVFANQITREGFTLHFKTWDDSRLDNAAVSWIAVGR